MNGKPGFLNHGAMEVEKDNRGVMTELIYPSSECFHCDPLLLLLTALCLHIHLMVHKFNRTPLTCEVITYGALYKVRHAQCKPAAFISAGYPTEMPS